MEWLIPWYPVPEGREEMTAELAREVSGEHPLFGVPTTTLARRQDCDDVLFKIEDGTGRVAVVHLTWAGHRETNPIWPATVIYESLTNWATTAMVSDHVQFT